MSRFYVVPNRTMIRDSLVEKLKINSFNLFSYSIYPVKSLKYKIQVNHNQEVNGFSPAEFSKCSK